MVGLHPAGPVHGPVHRQSARADGRMGRNAARLVGPRRRRCQIGAVEERSDAAGSGARHPIAGQKFAKRPFRRIQAAAERHGGGSAPCRIASAHSAAYRGRSWRFVLKFFWF